MDAVIVAAQAYGHIFIDLYNNGLSALAYGFQVVTGRAEIKPSLLIHRRYLEHRHIQRFNDVGVKAGQLGIAHGNIIGKSLIHSLALNTAHVPGVPCKVARRFRHIKNRGPVGQDPAPDLHIRQLIRPLRQRLVQRNGRADTPAIIQPVAGFDHLHRIGGGGQFLFVCVLIAHRCSSCIPFYDQTAVSCGAVFSQTVSADRPQTFRRFSPAMPSSYDRHTFHKIKLYHINSSIAMIMSKK